VGAFCVDRPEPIESPGVLTVDIDQDLPSLLATCRRELESHHLYTSRLETIAEQKQQAADGERWQESKTSHR
jgi:hypothetical protein